MCVHASPSEPKRVQGSPSYTASAGFVSILQYLEFGTANNSLGHIGIRIRTILKYMQVVLGEWIRNGQEEFVANCPNLQPLEGCTI